MNAIAEELSTKVADLAEGNIGALLMLNDLVRHLPRISPETDASLVLDALATIGLKGLSFYNLYADICSFSLPKVVAVVFAWQLGLVTAAALAAAVRNVREGKGAGLQVAKLYRKVALEVPSLNFNIEGRP